MPSSDTCSGPCDAVSNCRSMCTCCGVHADVMSSVAVSGDDGDVNMRVHVWVSSSVMRVMCEGAERMRWDVSWRCMACHVAVVGDASIRAITCVSSQCVVTVSCTCSVLCCRFRFLSCVCGASSASASASASACASCLMDPSPSISTSACDVDVDVDVDVDERCRLRE